MKILLINGSARKNGGCFRALEEIKLEILKSDAEVFEYDIGTAPRYACSHCLGCKDGNGCIYRDIDGLTELCNKSDAIIICTPTHYASAPGNLTAVLSRLLFSSKKSVAYKPIGVGGVGRRGGVCDAIQDVKKFFEFAFCPIISGVYPAILYTDGYQNAAYDEEGVQNMRSLAKNVIYIAQCIEYGNKNGIPRPKEEERIKTDIPALLRLRHLNKS